MYSVDWLSRDYCLTNSISRVKHNYKQQHNIKSGVQKVWKQDNAVYTCYRNGTISYVGTYIWV